MSIAVAVALLAVLQIAADARPAGPTALTAARVVAWHAHISPQPDSVRWEHVPRHAINVYNAARVARR